MIVARVSILKRAIQLYEFQFIHFLPLYSSAPLSFFFSSCSGGSCHAADVSSSSSFVRVLTSIFLFVSSRTSLCKRRTKSLERRLLVQRNYWMIGKDSHIWHFKRLTFVSCAAAPALFCIIWHGLILGLSFCFFPCFIRLDRFFDWYFNLGDCLVRV